MRVLFSLNHKLLEKAGYSKIMSHVYGKKHDMEWITQASWNKNNFPRFHLLKDKGEWDLHYDFYAAGEDGHKSDSKSQIVRNERNRLLKLSKYLAYAAMIKKGLDKSVHI
ncbi:MAG: hypothetical protein QMD86_02890 [Patescibacteria group bacterium]|nr:hypothetical protein [Patescibacteria group bacterium]